MQPPLSYREVCSCLAPISPGFPPPHPDAPSKCREASGGVPSPGFPALMSKGVTTRPWHTGTPGSCHAPPAPAALSITQSGQGAGGDTQKVVGVGGGWAPTRTHPWALLFGTVPAGVGGTAEARPPWPLPGESLAAGAGTGTSLGERWPPSTSGKGTIPGHFFFGRPRVPSPPLNPPLPSSSRARARGHN